MRVGALPVAMRPNFGAGGSAISPARIAMRKSMPRGANVQRAVQSMKSRNGGAERRPVKHLGDGLEIVAAGGARGPHDAGRDAGAERHADEGAGFELCAHRRAIAVSRVDGDRGQHVDDDALRHCVIGGVGRRRRHASV